MRSLFLKVGNGILPVAALALAVFLSPVAYAETYECTDKQLVPMIAISSAMPTPKTDGSTGGVNICAGAAFAWNAFMAVNWPAQQGGREIADTSKRFGQGSPTVWETMRAKVEVYPGNASAMVPPHGVVLSNAKPSNPPDYGYNQAPEYFYSPTGVKTADGRIKACAKQTPVTVPAWIPLDETTQIGNNQTFAGVLPEKDAKGLNSKPQLIRYAVKMNKALYTKVIGGQYWYNTAGSPLQKAKANYVTALKQGTGSNPVEPYVNFAHTNFQDPYSVEVKSSWRPLTDQEAASGRFYQSKVRYYEEDATGTACYREDVWGLVGMHLISFPANAPWVIWATFEQSDNILTADNSRTEDENGNILKPNPGGNPTTPMLSSDPKVLKPVVTKTGDYCDKPGARLFFRENPNYGTLPADGNICVNARWNAIQEPILTANKVAHQTMQTYLNAPGSKSKTSPWLFYKLVNVQAEPVDYAGKDNPRFGTTATYYSANVTIETDYSLGMFNGRLVNGVPSTVEQAAPSGPLTGYTNTNLLPFQSGRLSFQNMNAGGCAGCHGNTAARGNDFSFALGDNVAKPEAVDAFNKAKGFRNYMPPAK